MEELKHDMSKQIDEKTAKIKEYECTIDRLRAEIESLKLTLDRA